MKEAPKRSNNSTATIVKRAAYRYLKLLAFSVSVVALASVAVLFALWYHVFRTSLWVRWIRIHVYEEMLAVYAALLLLVPIGLVASAIIGTRAYRARDRKRSLRAGRAFLACTGLLISIVLAELICSWKLRSIANLDHLPRFHASWKDSELKPKPDSRPLRQTSEMPNPQATYSVVTIGGSSAQGLPFYPRMSLDRIITWQLRHALPDTLFYADNRAFQGITLERAIERLGGLTQRPDLLIIYSGHNEFQSRFGWGRKAPHYHVEPKISPPTLAKRVRAMSYAAEFLGQNADRYAVELGPPPRYVVDPADSPCCTPEEYETTLKDYRRRLDGLLDDCDAAGIMTIVVVPPSNDGDFDPNHSILSPDTSLDGQRDFMARIGAVKRIEITAPEKAIEGYRRLIDEQPGFAESHYRLARLLESKGDYAHAHDEYIMARDLDGIPFRCPTPFLEVCRELAKKHGSILIDAPRLLESASAHGILNDRFFVDAHHPGLNTFVIIAKDAIRQLKLRKAFGWPRSTPIPEFSLADCIDYFKLDTAAWIDICVDSRKFYDITARLPRDASWRRLIASRYTDAIELLKSGKSPSDTGIPSLRVDEELKPKQYAYESR